MTIHHTAVALCCAALACSATSHAAVQKVAKTISSTIRVGQLNRSFMAYIPANLPANAPMVLALHGSYGTSELMRKQTGQSFERLADQQGFVVVYPDGYEKNWNDCRQGATYAARQLNIDDIGFMRELIAHFQQSDQVDPKHVYAMGYSSGG